MEDSVLLCAHDTGCKVQDSLLLPAFALDRCILTNTTGASERAEEQKKQLPGSHT